MSNYKTVFFTLGILQIILGISMFIPIIAQFIYSEIDSSFFGASIVSIIFGSLFFLSNSEPFSTTGLRSTTTDYRSAKTNRLKPNSSINHLVAPKLSPGANAN